MRLAAAKVLAFLLGAEGVYQRLERYMHHQFKPVLTLAAQQPSHPQPKFLTGPRQDPCQRLTSETCQQRFTWFHPKTLVQSRLVSRQWQQEIDNYVSAFLSVLPEKLNEAQLATLSKVINHQPKAFGLSADNNEIVILFCHFHADSQRFVSGYRRGTQIGEIHLSKHQMAYWAQSAGWIISSVEVEQSARVKFKT